MIPAPSGTLDAPPRVEGCRGEETLERGISAVKAPLLAQSLNFDALNVPLLPWSDLLGFDAASPAVVFQGILNDVPVEKGNGLSYRIPMLPLQ